MLAFCELEVLGFLAGEGLGTETIESEESESLLMSRLRDGGLEGGETEGGGI